MALFRAWIGRCWRTDGRGVLRVTWPHAAGTLIGLTLISLALAPVAWAQREAPEAEDAFAQAAALQSRALHGPAAAAFADFRQRYPEHPSAAQALYLEARSVLALGRQDAAIQLFDTLQREYPLHPKAESARLQLAQTFLERGETERGVQQLRSVLASAPDDATAARALYLLGDARQDDGALETALAYYQRVAEDYPDTDLAPAALYAAGVVQVKQDRFEAAASAFEALGQRFPDSEYAQTVGTALAEVYFQLGQYENAVREVDQRLPTLSTEERARALFLQAESQRQLARYADARSTYASLLDRHASSRYVRPAQYGLGWIRYRQGQYQEAARSFAAARGSSTDALAESATYHAAVSHARAGRTDEAVARFREVANTWPDGSFAGPAQFEVGMQLYEAGSYRPAAAAFRKYLQTFDDDPDRRADAQYWLGSAYLALGELDRALDTYEQADAPDAVPDSALREVRYQQAWARYQAAEYDAAASAFRAIAEDAPTSERGIDGLFWAAESYFQVGSLGQAQDLFQQYLERRPQGSRAAAARYSLAWTHFKQENYRAAARAFEAFLQRSGQIASDVPYEQDARLRLADSYYALKRYDEAVSAYRQATSGPGADYALFQTGQALSVAGDPQGAIEAYQRLANRYPNSTWRPEALYRLGFVHLQQQNYDAARQAYRRVLDEHGTSSAAPQAQYGIGDAYYNEGRMERAAAAYRTVLETYPDAPLAEEAASSLFFALNAAGRSDRAEAVVDSFAAANPNADIVSVLRFRRAEAAYQTGDVQEAQRLFQRFLRRSSNEQLLPEAYYYLGIIFADRNRPDEASTYLQQLLDRYPESPRRAEAALRLGDIRLDEGDAQAALNAYRTAAETEGVGDDLRAQARYGQSVALLRLERLGEAEELLQRVLETNRGGPLLASARLGLARIREQQGETDEALRLYRTVVEQVRSETAAEALYRLGRLLLDQGQAQAAIRELDRTPALFGGYPEWIARSLLAQADAYQQLGQPGEASRLYDRVMEEHAGTRFAEQARERKSAL